jgi:hypothetical protein
MSEDNGQQPVAGWFTPAAMASLLFMVLGCIMYLMHVLTDPDTLPLEQRIAFEALPVWVVAAQAVAVWVGLAGTALLFLRRKLAEPALLVSVVAVLVWLAGLLAVTGVRENMSANDLLVAIVVSAITWTIYWFARRSRQRGWLR